MTITCSAIFKISMLLERMGFGVGYTAPDAWYNKIQRFFAKHGFQYDIRLDHWKR